MVKISKTKPPAGIKKQVKVTTKKAALKKPSFKARSIKESPSPKKLKKTPNETPLNATYVKSAVSALFKLNSLNKSKKDLLDSETPIELFIGTIKIPDCKPRILRPKMVNSLHNDASEICIITADLKNEDAKNHDKNVDYYEDFLRANGVTRKVTIMPYHQLRTEYLEFEMQRRLVALYDVFLVDGRISGFVKHKFFQHFFKKHKSPIPIMMESANFKHKFEQALLKEELHIHPNGNSFVFRVGHTDMEEAAVVENIMSTYAFIEKEFPGGFNNVQNLNIKVPGGIDIPIYMTLKSNADVEIPVVKIKKLKNSNPVTEEASILDENAQNVTVFPGGKVVVDNEKPKRRRSKKRLSKGKSIDKTKKLAAKKKVAAKIKPKLSKTVKIKKTKAA